MMGLSLSSVEIGYGRHTVVNDLSLEIDAGQLVGLIGPNGSGKSTIIRALAGVHPYRGTISFASLSGQRLRETTGYMPQDLPGDVALTALESVIIAARTRSSWRTSRSDIEAALDALTRLDIAFLANRYLAECSGGQRQLVSLAQTLVRQPALIVLDEPTSALDLRHQALVLRRVADAVRNPEDEQTSTHTASPVQKRIAVIVLHDLNLAARYCDELVLLKQGSLVAHGTPEEVLTPDTLDAVYGIESRIIRDGQHIMVASG